MPTMQAVLHITPEQCTELNALCDQYEWLPGHASARPTLTIWGWGTLDPGVRDDPRYAVYMPVLENCEVEEIDIETSFPQGT